MNIMEYTYFQVNRVEIPGRKTPDWQIVSRSNGALLGVIKWYGPWRQPCFFPQANVVWSDGCLKDVMNALGRIKRRDVS